jgi:8-oxo-dGTP diphosphatase
MKVAVALIIDNQQQVLITQRQKNKPYGGLWEFPGGKSEIGETIEETLRREIQEEVGIDCLQHQQIGEIITDSAITLCIFEVMAYQGEAIAREGQMGLQWLSWDKLKEINMLPANEKIIQLKLSRV